MRGPLVRGRVSNNAVLERMLDSSREEDHQAEPTTHEPRKLQSASKGSMPQSDKKVTKDSEMVAARKYCFENNMEPKTIKQVMKQMKSAVKDENHDCNRESMNRGAMLYERNVRLVRENEKRLQQQAELARANEQQQLTFQPQINPLSDLIVEKLRKEQPGRLAPSHTESNSRLSSLKKFKEAEDMAECSFHPSINDCSRKMLLSRSVAIASKFDELYEDAMRKRASQEASASRPTVSDFHPQVNPLSEMIVNGVPFEQRMEIYERERQEKLADLRSRKQSEQQTLMNSIKSRPRSVRMSSSEKLTDLKRTRCQKTQTNGSPVKQSHVGSRSNSIYNDLKLRCFRHIFELLDSDKDGIINSIQIDITGLHRQVLRIVAPLLARMEAAKQNMAEIQFLSEMEELFGGLLPHERHELLGVVRPQSPIEIPPHRPNLNKKSLILAQRVRGTGPPGQSIYEFCLARKQQREQWLQEQRKLTAERLMQHCSFVPNRKG